MINLSLILLLAVVILLDSLLSAASFSSRMWVSLWLTLSVLFPSSKGERPLGYPIQTATRVDIGDPGECASLSAAV